MTVWDLMWHVTRFPPERQVVIEYDSNLYPVTGVRLIPVGPYPVNPLAEGQLVVQIEHAEYQ